MADFPQIPERDYLQDIVVADVEDLVNLVAKLREHGSNPDVRRFFDLQNLAVVPLSEVDSILADSLLPLVDSLSVPLSRILGYNPQFSEALSKIFGIPNLRLVLELEDPRDRADALLFLLDSLQSEDFDPIFSELLDIKDGLIAFVLRHLRTPVTLGELTVSFVDFERDKSLFDPDVNLQVAVDFSGFGLSLVCRGLYLDTRGQIPYLNTSRLQIDENFAETITNFAAQKLRDSLPSQIQGVKLQSFELDVEGLSQGRNLAVMVDVEFALAEQFPKFQAKQVTLSSNGSLSFAGPVEFSKTFDPPYLIMAPDFSILSMSGAADIAEKQIKLAAKLGSQSDPNGRTLRIDASIAIDLSNPRIDLEGTLVLLNRHELADLDGIFRLDPFECSGNISIPGHSLRSLEKFINIDGDFHLDKGGFRCSGSSSVLKSQKLQFHGSISEAGMSLRSTGSFTPLPGSSSAVLEADISPSARFKARFSFQRRMRVRVKDFNGKKVTLFRAQAIFGVSIDSSRGSDSIKVAVSIANVSFTIAAKDLDPGKLLRLIENEISKRFKQVYENSVETLITLGQKLADGIYKSSDRFVRSVFKRAEKADLFTITTGDPLVDGVLSDISTSGQHLLDFRQHYRNLRGLVDSWEGRDNSRADKIKLAERSTNKRFQRHLDFLLTFNNYRLSHEGKNYYFSADFGSLGPMNSPIDSVNMQIHFTGYAEESLIPPVSFVAELIFHKTHILPNHSNNVRYRKNFRLEVLTGSGPMREAIKNYLVLYFLEVDLQRKAYYTEAKLRAWRTKELKIVNTTSRKLRYSLRAFNPEGVEWRQTKEIRANSENQHTTYTLVINNRGRTHGFSDINIVFTTLDGDILDATFKYRPFSLIPANPKFNNQRVYLASKKSVVEKSV